MDYKRIKESDEKIRQFLIHEVTETSDEIMSYRNMNKKDVLNWLEKQSSVEEIVKRCKTSWYNEGKIQGMIEGLSDDEKYQQGWHDALEKQAEQKQEDEDMSNQGIDWGDDVEEIDELTDQIVEWDDEDDAMLNQIIEDVEKLAGPYVCYYKDINWLKSLRDRIQGKTTSEAIKE